MDYAITHVVVCSFGPNQLQAAAGQHSQPHACCVVDQVPTSDFDVHATCKGQQLQQQQAQKFFRPWRQSLHD
jgi:hypothetical protein